MVSFLHEGIVELVRGDPWIILDLLEKLGIEVPPGKAVSVVDSALNQLKPAEFRADLVFVLKHDEKPQLAVVLEVQLREDPHKKYSWLLYWVLTMAAHGCDVIVVVICPDPKVAEWARQPILFGRGHIFQPVALGPDQIPRVTDDEEAAKSPELAVLSALTHNRRITDIDVQRAAVAALKTLDGAVARVYYDIMLLYAAKRLRKLLEKEMDPKTYEFQSDFAKKQLAKGRAEGEAKGRAEGEAKGRAEGEAKGRAEGEAKGRAEGEAKGRARALLQVLDLRHVAIGPEERDRILTCTNLKQLDRWLAAALTATSINDVLPPGNSETRSN